MRQLELSRIDKEDSPEGYVPVLKPKNPTHNICRDCDWRKDCQKQSMLSQKEKLSLYNLGKFYTCMSRNRADGQPVLFKKNTIKRR